MRFKIGSNQYKKKRYNHTLEWLLVLGVIIDLTLGVRVGYLTIRNHGIDLAQAQEEIISPVAPPETTPTPIPTLTPEQFKKSSIIENYIKSTFGKDGDMAVEVQHHECNPIRKDYPNCEKNDEIEYSCGLFQINLRAHAKKVAGITLEEKCNKLKSDPYYSTLIAYKIFKDNGSFCAWTFYLRKYCK